MMYIFLCLEKNFNSEIILMGGVRIKILELRFRKRSYFFYGCLEDRGMGIEYRNYGG